MRPVSGAAPRATGARADSSSSRPEPPRAPSVRPSSCAPAGTGQQRAAGAGSAGMPPRERVERVPPRRADRRGGRVPPRGSARREGAAARGRGERMPPTGPVSDQGPSGESPAPPSAPRHMAPPGVRVRPRCLERAGRRHRSRARTPPLPRTARQAPPLPPWERARPLRTAGPRRRAAPRSSRTAEISRHRGRPAVLPEAEPPPPIPASATGDRGPGPPGGGRCARRPAGRGGG